MDLKDNGFLSRTDYTKTNNAAAPLDGVNVYSEAYRMGVNHAHRGIIRATHLIGEQNKKDFFAGWDSVARTHAAVVLIMGEVEPVYIGTLTQCNDAAVSYKARHPSAVVRVEENPNK